MIVIKVLAQLFGQFFRFKLQQNAVEQCQVPPIHVLDFLVQNWTQFIWLDWLCCWCRFHSSPIYLIFQEMEVLVGNVSAADRLETYCSMTTMAERGGMDIVPVVGCGAGFSGDAMTSSPRCGKSTLAVMALLNS